jgi:hypothetical protein
MKQKRREIREWRKSRTCSRVMSTIKTVFLSKTGHRTHEPFLREWCSAIKEIERIWVCLDQSRRDFKHIF